MTVEQILWLGAFVVFLAIEAGTLGLVSIWFAAGSLGALVLAWLGCGFWIQVAVFLVLSCATLACFRPLVKKYVEPKIVATNADSLVGVETLITGDVDNIQAKGELMLGGVTWSARSTGGEPIPAGTRVRVDRIEGVRLYVSPVEVKAEV